MPFGIDDAIMLAMAANSAYQATKGAKSAKGSQRPGFEYTGAVPYEPDLTKLKEVEKELYKILGTRSSGQDIGFDPARRSAQEALIQSSLKRREGDQLRDASGRLSGAGLSGNARAQEAISGRIQRDNSQDLADQLSRISIEDLGAAREDKNRYTDKYQNFYGTNVNQQNKVADFDYAKDMGVEQLNRGQDVIDYGQNLDAGEASGESIGSIMDILSSIGGGGASKLSTSIPASGYGAAPGATSGGGLGMSQGQIAQLIGQQKSRRRVGGY